MRRRIGNIFANSRESKARNAPSHNQLPLLFPFFFFATQKPVAYAKKIKRALWELSRVCSDFEKQSK